MAGDQHQQEAPDLLLEMRAATRRAHHVANALILSKLVVVLTDPQLYARALGSFHPVYATLEELLAQHTGDTGPLGRVIGVVAQIPRTAAMEQDLQHFLGPSWRDKVAPSAAAAAYAQHLRSLSQIDPLLLLPYAFSMYIPILLGFMAQRISRTLQLPDEKGLAFFTVPDKAARLAQLREAVRAAGEGMDPELRRRIVEEAVEQFRQNNAVVGEFSVGWASCWRALQLAASAVPFYLWALAGAAAVGGAGVLAAGLAAAAGK